MTEKISDRIIAKAVDIWCKALRHPKFDNGDTSQHGFLGMALATTLIESDKSKTTDMPNRIEVFRKAITDELIRLRDTPEDGEYFQRWLDVDYHPCRVLSNAADLSGIPHSQFSCKSSVMIDSDAVVASFGYGARREYYYPLPDGKWLVAALCGEDIDKVIASAMNGNPLGLKVED